MMEIVLVTQLLVYIVVSAPREAKLWAHRGDPEGPECMCVKEERGRDVLHRGSVYEEEMSRVNSSDK